MMKMMLVHEDRFENPLKLKASAIDCADSCRSCSNASSTLSGVHTSCVGTAPSSNICFEQLAYLTSAQDSSYNCHSIVMVCSTHRLYSKPKAVHLCLNPGVQYKESWFNQLRLLAQWDLPICFTVRFQLIANCCERYIQRDWKSTC